MKLLREPMLHFAILGVALFLIHAVVSGLFSTDPRRRIEIGGEDIDLLAENFRRTWQRPPTGEELRRVVEARVREEVLYREALAVGLDENDVVVRRRLVQKMEMLSEDLALLADPTDRELQQFFQERAESYRIPPRISFNHVYFNMDRRGPAGEEQARQVLARILARTPLPRSAAEQGDRFLLSYDFNLASPEEVQRAFGKDFSEALFKLEGGWHGPIASAYGLHLVYVEKKVPGRIPEYTEIRDRLVTDYSSLRRKQAREALYEGLSRQYEIRIEEEALQGQILDRPKPPSD